MAKGKHSYSGKHGSKKSKKEKKVKEIRNENKDELIEKSEYEIMEDKIQDSEVVNDDNKPKKKHRFLKFLLKLFIALILFVAGFAGYLFLFNYENVKPSSTQDSEYDSSSAKSIDESYTIDYLELDKLSINKDDSNKYNVSTIIKNNDDKLHEKIILRINLFDNEKNIITYLDCKIDKIEKKGKVSASSQVEKDLSNCKYYSVSIQ